VIVVGVPQVLGGHEAVRRLDALLRHPDAEPYTGTGAIDHRGDVALESVTFGYGDDPLLHDVDLRVGRGERVALFGPNGAGKSTIVNLLLGLYRPDEGRVLADGIPYDELDVVSLRRGMGVVLQDPIIFQGSVADNIAYGHPDAGSDEIRRAAEWAMADDFIKALPHGYDSDVGDDGNLLSGGQRQRIAIARALLDRPSLLILDEPTTHLDDAAIGGLLDRLCNFPGMPAVLMVSHDPEVALVAETVYHLRDGRLVRIDHHSDTALATA
jgi:ATP-binding cassette subfamily B protein